MVEMLYLSGAVLNFILASCLMKMTQQGIKKTSASKSKPPFTEIFLLRLMLFTVKAQNCKLYKVINYIL